MRFFRVLIYPLFFLFFPLSVFSQKSTTYRFSEDILRDLQQDSTPQRFQSASWALSNIGEYKELLATWDQGQGQGQAPVLSTENQEYFRKFKALNALSYIVARARKERIVIINEAHQQPNHRIFMESLLDSLYAIGYKFLGIETLNKKDSLLNKRGYPIIESGFYSRQPQFGNLIRTALGTGYTLFAYDSDSYDGETREKEQAQNVKKILDANPDSKILIYCGFDHIVETDYPYWGKAMAGRLKEYTGIDPFTIDQVKLTETSSKERDNPFYKMADLPYYAAFVDSAYQPFRGSIGFDQYDMLVYHPRARWLHGRPDWVFQNGRLPYAISQRVKTSFPCLVYAYYFDEDISKTVPVDVIELHDRNDDRALSLKKGKYLVVVRDMNGKEEQINIEL
jgi:hypothetical protein